MISTIEEFVHAAGVLTADDRLHLIDALWETIPADKWPQPSPEELAIVQRRSQEFDCGGVTALPWPEVKSRLKARIGQGHE